MLFSDTALDDMVGLVLGSGGFGEIFSSWVFRVVPVVACLANAVAARDSYLASFVTDATGGGRNSAFRSTVGRAACSGPLLLLLHQHLEVGDGLPKLVVLGAHALVADL